MVNAKVAAEDAIQMILLKETSLFLQNTVKLMSILVYFLPNICQTFQTR
jgi:hypothetical protein